MSSEPETNTIEAKALSMDERIFRLNQDVWIGYPRAIKIRERLDGLLRFPTTHRMPNLLIVGDSNNGKTMLVNNFVKRNTPASDPNAEKTLLPILLIQTPAAPDETRLYRAILGALFADGPNREPKESMLKRIMTLFASLEIRMLIMDEFNNSLGGGYLKLRAFLNALRCLGNELKIPIVVTGTVEAQRALGSDPQLANRFEPVFLPRWKESEEFERLLTSFERELGLQHKSNLWKKTTARKILLAGDGLIGDMLMLLRRLAEKAIREGQERIDPKWLERRFLDDFGWVTPSMRMRSAG